MGLILFLFECGILVILSSAELEDIFSASLEVSGL